MTIFDSGAYTYLASPPQGLGQLPPPTLLPASLARSFFPLSANLS